MARDERDVRLVADLLGHLRREPAEHDARHHGLLDQTGRDAETRHQLAVPVAGRRVEQARRGGVGVLVRRDAREPPVEVVGNREQALGARELVGVLLAEGHELVDRVERLTLDARAPVQLLGGDGDVDELGDALRASIAIRDGVADELALAVEQHEVAAPGVDADGQRRCPRRRVAGPESRDDLVCQRLDVPAVVTVHAPLAVDEAVHLLEAHLSAIEPTEQNASARRPDIDRCEALLGRQVHDASPSIY